MDGVNGEDFRVRAAGTVQEFTTAVVVGTYGRVVVGSVEMS